MPLPKMNCKQCGREFYVLQAIQRVFCSPECRYLNNKGLLPISLDNAARIRATEKGDTAGRRRRQISRAKGRENVRGYHETCTRQGIGDEIAAVSNYFRQRRQSLCQE